MKRPAKQKLVRLTEGDLHRMVDATVKCIIRESFEDDYNDARNNYTRPCWGFEMKNKDNEWEYGDVSYDPNTQTMSCMGVTIDVDTDCTVDQNLQALYEKLTEEGYHDGDDEE
jgi:hypothetical protein